MEIYIFIVLSISYLLTMHMMVGVEKNFTYWMHLSCFGFGALIGWYLGSYTTGFVFAVVFHMLLTSSAFG